MPFPNPATQFKKGQSGNPAGISGEALQARRKASEDAHIVRAKVMAGLAKRSETMSEDDFEAIMEYLVSSDIRGFLNDANDRHDGKPVQSTDITNSDESLKPDEPLDRLEIARGMAMFMREALEAKDTPK